MTSVIQQGRLRLRPLLASRCRKVLEVDVDLDRADGQLTIGDLRRAAERLEDMGRYESAHRMWTAVGAAVRETDDDALERYADDRAADAIERAAQTVTDMFRQSGVRYDYTAIASDRADGETAAAVAATHGCSTSTVRRAVEWVATRDELLAANRNLGSALVEGADPERLARFFDADPNLIRWMLASRFDRRTN